MNVQTKTLTAASYTARRGELQNDLREAEAKNASAELRASLNEISDDELSSSRAVVETIKAKLRGLDAARSESCRLEEQEAAEREAQARRAAAEQIRAMLPERTKAFRAVLKAIATAARHAEEYDRLSEDIRHVARSIEPRVADAFVSFAEELGPHGNGRNKEALLVDAILAKSCLRLWGVGQTAGWAHPNAPELDVFIASKTKRLHHLIAIMAGEGED